MPNFEFDYDRKLSPVTTRFTHRPMLAVRFMEIGDPNQFATNLQMRIDTGANISAVPLDHGTGHVASMISNCSLTLLLFQFIAAVACSITITSSVSCSGSLRATRNVFWPLRRLSPQFRGVTQAGSPRFLYQTQSAYLKTFIILKKFLQICVFCVTIPVPRPYLQVRGDVGATISVGKIRVSHSR